MERTHGNNIPIHIVPITQIPRDGDQEVNHPCPANRHCDNRGSRAMAIVANFIHNRKHLTPGLEDAPTPTPRRWSSHSDGMYMQRP